MLEVILNMSHVIFIQSSIHYRLSSLKSLSSVTITSFESKSPPSTEFSWLMSSFVSNDSVNVSEFAFSLSKPMREKSNIFCLIWILLTLSIYLCYAYPPSLCSMLFQCMVDIHSQMVSIHFPLEYLE